MTNTDFKFEDIGFNGAHLSAMPKDQFTKEVAHHFEGKPEKVNELYDLIQKQYPQKSVPEAPAKPAKKSEPPVIAMPGTEAVKK